MWDCRSLTAMFRALHDEPSLETTLTARRTEMASSEMPRLEEDMNSLGGSRGDLEEKAIRDNAGQPWLFASPSRLRLWASCPLAQFHDHRREKRKTLGAAWPRKTPPA